MRVLLSCHVPFSLAHGGAQIQIEQTRAALEQIGVEVEPLRWWDERQTGDVLHHFGRMPPGLIRLAQQKGIKVVLGEFLTEQGSRPAWRLTVQCSVMRLMRAALPRKLIEPFRWGAFPLADACVALTAWEGRLMTYLFGAPRAKVHIVPNGVDMAFLDSRPVERGPWLVCTATITPRKRVLELAEAAIRGQVPVWIIGASYADTDTYARRFFELARVHPNFIRFEGPIQDRHRLANVYRETRGFVLLSTMESLSLSALEAAACGCPLLLSDLPWARETFGDRASYCPARASTEATAAALRRFYDAAPGLPRPHRPLSWLEVAQQLKGIYESLLAGNLSGP
jgi:glycosyltransferase involved in cell wall biosynthesis